MVWLTLDDSRIPLHPVENTSSLSIWGRGKCIMSTGFDRHWTSGLVRCASVHANPIGVLQPVRRERAVKTHQVHKMHGVGRLFFSVSTVGAS